MQIYVTPQVGARVRNPENGFAVIPSGGDVVTDSPYFRRLEAEKSVTIETLADRKAAAKKAAAKPVVNVVEDKKATSSKKAAD